MSVNVGDKATADSYNNRPKILRGTVSIAPSAANTITAGTPIVFPVGFFSSTPIIQMTVNSSASTNLQPSYSAATAAGFTPYLYAGNTTARTIAWMAVGDGPA